LILICFILFLMGWLRWYHAFWQRPRINLCNWSGNSAAWSGWWGVYHEWEHTSAAEFNWNRTSEDNLIPWCIMLWVHRSRQRQPKWRFHFRETLFIVWL